MSDRDERRADRIATSWRHDPELEERARLRAEQPDEYARIFGARADIELGLYEQGKAAARNHEKE